MCVEQRLERVVVLAVDHHVSRLVTAAPNGIHGRESGVDGLVEVLHDNELGDRPVHAHSVRQKLPAGGVDRENRGLSAA